MANKYDDPRWQRKRLEIMQRDGFACVACCDSSSTLHVHHKRYRGELWESPPEDLQTLCEACHAALGPHPRGGVWWVRSSVEMDGNDEVHLAVGHCPKCSCRNFTRRAGKYQCSSCEWAADLPGFASRVSINKPAKSVDSQPVFWGREVSSFYLAGKITGFDWRGDIVPGWTDPPGNDHFIPSEDRDGWLRSPVRVDAIDQSLHFYGPWWVDQSGGHCGPEWFPKRPHSSSGGKWSRHFTHRNIQNALRRCDMVFAWIDSFDCFGTLWELGVASGRRIPTVVAIKSGMRSSLDELWLSLEGAQVVIEAETAKKGWDWFWYEIARGLHGNRQSDDFELRQWNTEAGDAEAEHLLSLIAERRKIMGIV